MLIQLPDYLVLDSAGRPTSAGALVWGMLFAPLSDAKFGVIREVLHAVAREFGAKRLPRCAL